MQPPAEFNDGDGISEPFFDDETVAKSRDHHHFSSGGPSISSRRRLEQADKEHKKARVEQVISCNPM